MSKIGQIIILADDVSACSPILRPPPSTAGNDAKEDSLPIPTAFYFSSQIAGRLVPVGSLLNPAH